MLYRLLPFCCFFILACGCETDLALGDLVSDGTSEPEVVTPDADGINAVALRRVNEVRQAGCVCGSDAMPPVPPVSLDERLVTAARVHATDQAGMQKMQHTGSDGSDVGQRVSQAGYPWRAVAENVAWNYTTAEAVVTAWLNSPGHCRNIMNASYTHVGIGEDRRYWSQVFARQ